MHMSWVLILNWLIFQGILLLKHIVKESAFHGQTWNDDAITFECYYKLPSVCLTGHVIVAERKK